VSLILLNWMLLSTNVPPMLVVAKPVVSLKETSVRPVLPVYLTSSPSHLSVSQCHVNQLLVRNERLVVYVRSS